MCVYGSEFTIIIIIIIILRLFIITTRASAFLSGKERYICYTYLICNSFLDTHTHARGQGKEEFPVDLMSEGRHRVTDKAGIFPGTLSPSGVGVHCKHVTYHSSSVIAIA